MNHQGKKPVLIVNAHCAQFVEPLKNALTELGLWAFQSFDLRSTRALHEGCSCPHHGTSQCTCELVVLLIYQAEGDPLPLILDGRDGQTFVFISEEPGIRVQPSTLEAVERAVQKAAYLLNDHERSVDAEAG